MKTGVIVSFGLVVLLCGIGIGVALTSGRSGTGTPATSQPAISTATPANYAPVNASRSVEQQLADLQHGYTSPQGDPMVARFAMDLDVITCKGAYSRTQIGDTLVAKWETSGGNSGTVSLMNYADHMERLMVSAGCL